MNPPNFQRIINIGILAHVDAGKTTLTENLLHLAGAIKVLGSVDKGSSVSDSLELEKQRGISIKASSVSFTFENIRFNIIDTPGHIDFSSEIDRSLKVIDTAILLISSVEGVQAHTYSIANALKELKIPFVICVNKIDRAGSDFENIISEIQEELDIKVFPVFNVVNEGEQNAKIIDLWKDNQANFVSETGLENLALFSEKILEEYLESGFPEYDAIQSEAKTVCRKQQLIPVIPASLKNNIGTKELLVILNKWIEPVLCDISEEVSGYIFKLETHPQIGHCAHIRLFSGNLENRQEIFNQSTEKFIKISQIHKFFAGKPENIGKLSAGDTGVITCNDEIKPGDIIGKKKLEKPRFQFNKPLVLVKVTTENESDIPKLAEALSQLNKEDPMLNFVWHKSDNEMTIDLMGEIQADIIIATLLSRFSIKAEISNSSVIYKETPAGIGEGFAKYWMPKPCWAIIKLKIEPGESGSGVVYKSELSTDKIQKKYQNEIERTIPKALKQGIKGWEITDIIITLIDGEDHEVHSRPGDFIIATPMAIMKGLQETGTTLLEPIYLYEIIAEEEILGNIAGDLTNMRAEIGSPNFSGGKFKMQGKIPVSEAIKYLPRFNSITGGKGKIKFTFAGYQNCSDEHGVIREYKGINPLDESKWILHARGAYKADSNSSFPVV